MQILNILAMLIAAICVICPHEFAHAYVAYKNGDPTAKINGRMTLNPLKHLDPVGFVMCALVGFGWAKPVPINPYNFRNYKKGMFTTAIAGVSMNYIIAFVAYPLMLVTEKFIAPLLTTTAGAYLSYFLIKTFWLIFIYSLYLVVFNLLPFSPLDGFRVVEALTREVNPVQRFLRNYGKMILIILVAECFACDLLVNFGIYWASYFNILGYVTTFATDILGWPITALWDLIIR